MPFTTGRSRARALSDEVLAKLPYNALLVAAIAVLIAAVAIFVWSSLAVPADTVEGARENMRLSAIATAMCVGAFLVGVLALFSAQARVRVDDFERRRRFTVIYGDRGEMHAAQERDRGVRPVMRSRAIKSEDNG